MEFVVSVQTPPVESSKPKSAKFFKMQAATVAAVDRHDIDIHKIVWMFEQTQYQNFINKAVYTTIGHWLTDGMMVSDCKW